MKQSIHEPVFVREVITHLGCRRGGVYFDGTFGGGGHTRAILEATLPSGFVIATDRDQSAVERGQDLFRDVLGKRLKLSQANFADVGNFCECLLDGAVLDLGLSSDQLARGSRGFSFLVDGPLDMRMDESLKMTARDLVNQGSEKELTRILRDFGEEFRAGRIVSEIIKMRRQSPITSTLDLASLVTRAVTPRISSRKKKHSRGHFKKHPATKTFQALRIAVNQELDCFTRAIPAIVDQLKSGGRLCVISFHSLEDRIAKNEFKRLSGIGCDSAQITKIITRKPLTPSPEEVFDNPRARSAKLRVLEKL